MGEGACALLLRLRRPLGRPVAVEVETLERGRDRDRDAVPVPDHPLREQPEELALDVVGPATDEDTRVVPVRLPGAVRVAPAHEEDAPVAVDVLTVETVHRLVERIRPEARAAPAPVCEHRLRPVGIDARDDVEAARVERMRDPLVRPVAVQEPVEQVERRRRAGELGRVDLCVDDHRRLLLGRPRVEVRDRHERDLAALVRGADRLDGAQAWELRRPGGERLLKLRVRVEALELDAHERGR